MPSVLVHIMLYLGSLAAPFPLLRFPGFLGPAIYAGSACYQMAVSPLMLAVALSLDSKGELPHTMLWVLLLGATALALFGAGLMACFMVPEKRKTFYKHKSLKTYVNDHCWETRTMCVLGQGQDASRADALDFATWAWPPSQKVRTWLERWELWEEEQPTW